jgi:uncharacterized protein (TIGR02246 family)
MNRNATTLLLLGLLLLGAVPAQARSGPPTPTMPQSSLTLSPEDEKSIHALILDMEQRWRERDLPAYLAHFSEDADLVNRAGTWLKGKAQMEKQFRWLMEKGRPEMFSMKTRVEAIRPITPGVFILIQHRDESVRQSLATYVITRREDRWFVQSISIAPVEPPPGPQTPPLSR